MKTLLAGAQILELEKIVQMSGANTIFVCSAQAIVNCPSCRTVTFDLISRVLDAPSPTVSSSPKAHNGLSGGDSSDRLRRGDLHLVGECGGQGISKTLDGAHQLIGDSLEDVINFRSLF